MDSIKRTTGLNVELIKPNFKVHSFHKNFEDMSLDFEIIKMNQSAFIWIGSRKEMSFKDLSVAMVSEIQSIPVASQIMGNDINNTSTKIANKLAKKLNKQIFVSCNLVANRTQLLSLIQEILEEIKLHPDCI